MPEPPVSGKNPGMTTNPADRFAEIAAAYTVPALVDRNARDYGDLPALNLVGASGSAPSGSAPSGLVPSGLVPSGSVLTWSALRDRVAEVSRGLAGVGLEPGGLMLIMMANRPEHWLVDLGAAHLGAVTCTVYATLSTPQLRFLGRHSRAQVLVLEGAEQLARWRPVLAELPDLRAVVTVDETGADGMGADGTGADGMGADDRFVTLAGLSRRGAELHAADPAVFEAGWRAVRPDHPVAVLYTSGTTGDPKGVVLTHRNVVYQSAALDMLIDLPPHAESVAYLPLAHVAERVPGIYLLAYRAGHVHACPDPTQVIAALGQVRPPLFFGVPRIWEKIAAGLQAFLDGAGPPVRAAVEAAGEVALQVYRLRAAGQPVPQPLAERLAEVDAAVLRPIRARLGMDNLRQAYSGAAPIPVEVLLFLARFGITVLEVWGMTETSGAGTISEMDSFRPGAVGRPYPGIQVRIAGDGEILIRGPQVCAGYLRPDGTVEPVTDADGWLATGDIGTLDEDGFLTITDRKKELIITAGGKNISPAQIENLLRGHPLIGYAVAVGDRRPYVTALVALDEEAAPAWAKAHGIDAPDLAALAGHPAVAAAIQVTVDAANSALARVEQVKRFAVLPTGWSAESGELTPTLKLRRRVITERYAGVIESLYR
jgi:long-chain acyl-CoA synthetase